MNLWFRKPRGHKAQGLLSTVCLLLSLPCLLLSFFSFYLLLLWYTIENSVPVALKKDHFAALRGIWLCELLMEVHGIQPFLSLHVLSMRDLVCLLHNSPLGPIQMGTIVINIFFFLRQGLTVHFYLACSSLCRPGWSWTHRDPPAFVVLSAGYKGVCCPTWLVLLSLLPETPNTTLNTPSPLCGGCDPGPHKPDRQVLYQSYLSYPCTHIETLDSTATKMQLAIDICPRGPGSTVISFISLLTSSIVCKHLVLIVPVTNTEGLMWLLLF